MSGVLATHLVSGPLAGSSHSSPSHSASHLFTWFCCWQDLSDWTWSPIPSALAPCAVGLVSDKSLSELMSWSLLFFPRVLNLSLQSVLSWFIYMMKQREESAFIFLPVNTQISQHCLRIINITHNKYYVQHTYMLYITHTYISTWTCSCQRVTVNMREQFIGVISLSTMWVPGVKLYPSETSH